MKANFISSFSICLAAIVSSAYGQASQAPIVDASSAVVSAPPVTTGITSAILPDSLNPNATVIACPPRPSDAVYEDAHLVCPAGVPCAYNCTKDIHEEPIVVTKVVTSVTTVIIPVIVTTTIKTTSWITVFAASCTNFVTNFQKGKTVEVTETVWVTSKKEEYTYITEIEVVKATVTALCEAGPTGTPNKTEEDPPKKKEDPPKDGVIHYKWNGITGATMTVDPYPESSAWGDKPKDREECINNYLQTYQFLFSGDGDTGASDMTGPQDRTDAFVYANVFGFQKKAGSDGKPTLEKTTLNHEKYAGVKRDVLHAITSSWTVKNVFDQAVDYSIYQFSFMFHYIEQSHGPYYLVCGKGDSEKTADVVKDIKVPVRTLNYKIQPVYTLDFGPSGVILAPGEGLTCAVRDDKGNNMHVYLFDFVTCVAPPLDERH